MFIEMTCHLSLKCSCFVHFEPRLVDTIRTLYSQFLDYCISYFSVAVTRYFDKKLLERVRNCLQFQSDRIPLIARKALHGSRKQRDHISFAHRKKREDRKWNKSINPQHSSPTTVICFL